MKVKRDYSHFIGRENGYLKVIGIGFGQTNGFKDEGSYLICQCYCGNITNKPISRFNIGSNMSCGCMKSVTHGGRKSSEYRSWSGILDRCYNPKSTYFNNYGGRGICICDRWRTSFINFITDMGKKPTPAHSIERTNNNGNYTPDNCKWATKRQQALNRRSNVIIYYNGKSQTISQWAAELNIKLATLCHRIQKSKWPIEKALSVPVGKRFSNLKK